MVWSLQGKRFLKSKTERLASSTLHWPRGGVKFIMNQSGPMKSKVAFTFLAVTLLLAATLAIYHLPRSTDRERQQTDSGQASNPAQVGHVAATPELTPGTNAAAATSAARRRSPPMSAAQLLVTTNKLHQLAQIREAFRTLAAGDPASALRHAKDIVGGTERETALLTLVTEWTSGDLRPPRDRAHDIDSFGLEAGLGMELVKNPELAVLWANEMTDGPGRAALLQQTAIAMTDSDPTSAFALSEQVPQSEQRAFFDSVFAGWAQKDTDAALKWAGQLPDPAERDAAIQAIRSVAPVGIGTAVGVEDGYAVIKQLIPGTPAELSGQLHEGDRIVALAQGDNAFEDAHNIPLKDIVDMIRGMPGTVLQLQILSADAPPGSQPQIVSITRDQLKFKK